MSSRLDDLEKSMLAMLENAEEQSRAIKSRLILLDFIFVENYFFKFLLFFLFKN